jgi:hypothetical protein
VAPRRSNLGWEAVVLKNDYGPLTLSISLFSMAHVVLSLGRLGGEGVHALVGICAVRKLPGAARERPALPGPSDRASRAWQRKTDTCPDPVTEREPARHTDALTPGHHCAGYSRAVMELNKR